MRMFWITMLTLCSSAVALAQSCPDGGRYATNGNDFASCLYENITLPPASGIAPYCQYLQDGYIGFSWELNSQSYSCPSGASFSTNGAGLGFCIYDTPSPPAWATPYCDYLEQGYIGYSWRICPPGGRLTSNGTSEFCVWENLGLPRYPSPYCNYVDQGYFGFSYPLSINRTYHCPGGFVQTTNGGSTGFCLVENITPGQLSPYCNYLSSGYIGYSWPM